MKQGTLFMIRNAEGIILFTRMRMVMIVIMAVFIVVKYLNLS